MISVILYGRNDSHGYNLHKRAAISINCIAESLTDENDEIIFVDCNTPDDIPTFPEAIQDTLTLKAKKLLRILRIRNETYEKNKKDSHLFVLEPLARNVGIRRSNALNRWILSTNTDMVFVSRKSNKSLSQIVADLPSGFYELPRFEVPESLWETLDRKNPSENIRILKKWGERLHLNDVVISRPDIRYDGPGDFQLMLREQIFEIGGFDEEMVLGWHVDSNICKRLNLLNGTTETLIDEVFAYHCDHTRQVTLAHNYNRKENDHKRFCTNITSPFLPEQYEIWGLPAEKIEEIRINEDYGKGYIEALELMLPGRRDAYSVDYFDSDTFNHGLIYDTEHIFPYVVDNLSTFGSDWNYGYFGCNLQLLSKLGMFRLTIGHSGSIFYDEKLLQMGNTETLKGLPSNCIPQDYNYIFRTADTIIFDSGLNSFDQKMNKKGISFPKSSSSTMQYCITFYNTFKAAAEFEKNNTSLGFIAPRKFLFIASQNTWFESVTMQLFGIVLAPFSGHVRSGYIRNDAFSKTLIAPGLDTLSDPQDFINDLKRILNREVTLQEYYTAGMRLQEWISLHKDSQKFLDKSMKLPVTEVDFGLIKFRAEIYKAVDQKELSYVLDLIYTLLCKIHPNIADKIKEYVPDILNSERSAEKRHSLSSDIIVHAPLYDPSGYADESRTILFGLDQAGVKTYGVPLNWSKTKASLKIEEENRLNQLTKIPEKKLSKVISITNIFPDFYRRFEYADYHIGRAMYETEGIPKEWVAKCNMMDEVWVPSSFNFETFSKAGVSKEKLFIIPESIYVSTFIRNITPFEVQGRRRFNFLSVFDWSLRKGWDLLISSFLEEFDSNEDVSLSLKVWSSYGKSHGQILKQVKEFFGIKELPPNIIFIDQNLSTEQLAGLYKSSDCFVLPTRGEGWGRPFMEAMVSKIPVIGTRWSGQLEFMNDNNSYLIDCTIMDVNKEACLENPRFSGHRWAEPSLLHLKALMRKIVSGDEDRNRKISCAYNDIINKFNSDIVTEKIINRLNEIEKSLDFDSSSESQKDSAIRRNISINWKGPQYNISSLSLINREYCTRLAQNGFRVSIDSQYPGEITSSIGDFEKIKSLISKNTHPDITVSHHFPPDLRRPESGKWVIMQPWEFGSLPLNWVEKFSKEVDELWVPSSYVRSIYIESGIPENKVFVIPNGYNQSVFSSRISSFSLKTKKKFKFLFVGGTIFRKGIDLLLNAYTSTFNENEDVCLVIKDMGGDSFYSNQNYKEKIIEAANEPNTPQIEYIDEYLTDEMMCGLYNSCDVLVHPYRGEGFGLPVLEAMACGLPVIVTSGGACDDFCNNNNSIKIKSKKVFYKDKRVGDFETINHPWLLEPDYDVLKTLMRQVYNQEIDLNPLTKCAMQFVSGKFTWDHVYSMLEERILQISAEKLKQFKIHPSHTMLNNSDNLPIQSMHSMSEDLIAKGELEEAKKLINLIIEKNPNDIAALNNLGLISILNQDYKSAVDLLETVIDIDPDNEIALKNLIYIDKKL